MVQRKKHRTFTEIPQPKSDFFDGLPDDLVVCILCKLSSSSSSPSDFINILITCKRLNRLGLHQLVLSKAGPKTLSIKAKNWSDSAHSFLNHCVKAGNTEALYFLGMIRFYCLQNRRSGAALMAKAAMKAHAPALYSLAVIQFNGSGGSKTNKDLRAGVALCARAASLGHIDSLRELGHCLQDGYGIRQDVAGGRRLLVRANLREVMLSSVSEVLKKLIERPRKQHGTDSGCCPLLSDFGCNVGAPEVHPVNKFLREWFESGLEEGLMMCSHGGCGRPETRAHEFRRCSVCGTVNYCSRACQALDWKLSHKVKCLAIQRLINEGNGDDDHGHIDEE